MELANYLRIILAHLKRRRVLDDRLYLVLNIGYKYRVIGRSSVLTPELSSDADILVVADRFYYVYYVVGKFAGIIICRRFKRCSRTVVVYGHAAADIQIFIGIPIAGSWNMSGQLPSLRF